MNDLLAIAYGAGLKDGLNPCIFMTCAIVIAHAGRQYLGSVATGARPRWRAAVGTYGRAQPICAKFDQCPVR